MTKTHATTDLAQHALQGFTFESVCKLVNRNDPCIQQLSEALTDPAACTGKHIQRIDRTPNAVVRVQAVQCETALVSW